MNVIRIVAVPPVDKDGETLYEVQVGHWNAANEWHCYSKQPHTPETQEAAEQVCNRLNGGLGLHSVNLNYIVSQVIAAMQREPVV